MTHRLWFVYSERKSVSASCQRMVPRSYLSAESVSAIGRQNGRQAPIPLLLYTHICMTLSGKVSVYKEWPLVRRTCLCDHSHTVYGHSFDTKTMEKKNKLTKERAHLISHRTQGASINESDQRPRQAHM
jgi:hypothetical protein